MTHILPKFFTLALFLLVSACTNDNSRIDAAVTHCCNESTRPQSFTVIAEDIPAFLGPLLVSNFSVAFANIGMIPVEDNPDLIVTLRYEQSNLTVDRERDDFDERVGSGDAERFIARIVIEVRQKGDSRLVWSGHIQRLHDVGPGDYMHTGVASIAIYNAFTNVLKDYKK